MDCSNLGGDTCISAFAISPFVTLRRRETQLVCNFSGGRRDYLQPLNLLVALPYLVPHPKGVKRAEGVRPRRDGVPGRPQRRRRLQHHHALHPFPACKAPPEIRKQSYGRKSVFSYPQLADLATRDTKSKPIYMYLCSLSATARPARPAPTTMTCSLPVSASCCMLLRQF